MKINKKQLRKLLDLNYVLSHFNLQLSMVTFDDCNLSLCLYDLVSVNGTFNNIVSIQLRSLDRNLLIRAFSSVNDLFKHLEIFLDFELLVRDKRFWFKSFSPVYESFGENNISVKSLN